LKALITNDISKENFFELQQNYNKLQKAHMQAKSKVGAKLKSFDEEKSNLMMDLEKLKRSVNRLSTENV